MHKSLLFTLVVLATALAGCHGQEEVDTLVLAFTTKDDFTNPDADPQRLADWIAAETGLPTTIVPVDSEGAAIEALRFGHAHAAFLDGGAAWLAWKDYGLQAIAADQNSDGRTYYNAQAWVRADSDIQGFADLEGRISCHTGWLKSAGMLMPMGYLIGNNYAKVVGRSDDITSLQTTMDAFFSEARVPASGDPYYSYDGALRCLSDGTGDVAFVKDSTWNDYCETDAPAWCLPEDGYRQLPPFGQVPSHPVMVNPDLPAEARGKLVDALLALNDSDAGRSILEDVLNTPGITQVETDAHLGSYSENIQHVPGLMQHYQAKHDIEA